ncbi:unnamed protein product [Chironomus riparius]|uniref:N-acetylgalactosaminide beta-1,3-galactosyltransferase n=1 Tax=Chironomus riparius TaxID=315576 RepID=A0A9N9RHS7_9DIPT|nr:unnamed protein product [Chironomus riparius]
MEEESSTQLLLNPENKKTDRSKKFQQNRVANALLCGLVLGFIFSFLMAYSGVIEDAQFTKNIDFTISDFIQKNNFTLEVPQDANLAEFLYREVRVLCIMTPVNQGTLNDRGEIFLKTWTKRCHKFIFFADDPDERFKDNIIVLKDKSSNWARLKEAMTYVYKHHLNDFDWILKTNDNTYMVMENLRWLLYQYEPDWPLIIGQRYLEEDYMIGAYSISKRAFTRLIEKGFSNPQICDPKAINDDQQISKCLQRLNVLQIDALDDEGKGMFFRENPESALFPEKIDEYDKWFWHKLKQGPNSCCSDRLIAIQNVFNTHLYYFEYFIYKVHAFGRHRLPEPLPRKKNLEEIIKEKF